MLHLHEEPKCVLRNDFVSGCLVLATGMKPEQQLPDSQPRGYGGVSFFFIF